MKPHLIIDFRERCLFSLLIDKSGHIRPCTQDIEEKTLRYFFGEIFLDPGMYLDLNEEQLVNLFSGFEKSRFDILRRGKEIGWMRPHQLKIEEAAIPLKNPLNILSSAWLSESKAVNHSILCVSRVILDFLLEPIFRFLKENEFVFSQVKVTVVVPRYFSHRARLLLHLVLRERKFNGTMIIVREIAAAMSGLENMSPGIINIIDIENENTHLYRIEVKKSAHVLQIECTLCTTIPELGWQSITGKIGGILLKNKSIKDQSGMYRAYLAQAFMGLVFNVISTKIPSKPPVNVTQNMVDELLESLENEIWTDDPFKQLKDSLASIKKNGEMIIPIGMSFMIGSFETEVLRDFDDSRCLDILVRRPVERTAYGLAAGFRWLDQAPGRSIKIMNAATLRLVTRPAESMELAARHLLPAEPGECRIIKQIFDVHIDDKVSEDTIFFNLQWGNSMNPESNMNVCLLSLNAGRKDIEKNGGISIVLNLQMAKTGKELIGNVKIELGSKSAAGRFIVDNQVKEIGYKDIN